jgi:Ca-activated chloride channel family protein
LENEEFHDDKKDAGEMGSGHTVTALYEIVPNGTDSDYLAKTDDLKYQKTSTSQAGNSNELLTLKIRYKNPDSEVSKLFDVTVKNTAIPMTSASENFRFAASVAQFGLLLRNSAYKGKASYDAVINLARGAYGKDEEGYRSEFVRLVKTAQSIDSKETASNE